MLDAGTASWLRSEMAERRIGAVAKLQGALRAARMVLIGRCARHVDVVRLRTLDGGVLRFRQDGGRLEYFPPSRNQRLDRTWHDATEIGDWWALRDCADAVEQLCAEHLRKSNAGEVHRRGAEDAEEGEGGGG